LPLISACVWVMTIAHKGLKIKVKVIVKFLPTFLCSFSLQYATLEALHVRKAGIYVNGNVVYLTSVEGRNGQTSNSLRAKYQSFS